MTVNASLSVSNLINVTTSLAATAVQSQSTGTFMIVGSSPVIDTFTRARKYTSATAVAVDFGSAPEAAAATVWFAQTPQPQSLYIGRWAQTATAGQLFGAPLSLAQQSIAAWQAITTGTFTVSIGGTSQTITSTSFAGASNLNAVAALISAKLTGATMAYNSAYQQFVITATATGATSTVGFASAPGTGTDISSMLAMTQASIGAYNVAGIAAESALAAVTALDAQYGQNFYGITVLGAADSDHIAIAPFLSASSNKHFYLVDTQETGVLVSSTTTDIGYVLSAANVGKTAVQYSSYSPYAGISMMAKMLGVNYSGQNTALTAMYQQEPTITPEQLNVNQLSALIAKNCNAFLSYNNGASIIQPGICSNGSWIDAVIGADALSLAIQAAVFNLLYTSGTKVPQTDAGMHLIKVTIEQVLDQFAQNGFIAPGVWNSAGFGTLSQGQTLTSGYYVFQPPVATQSLAQRAQRISVPFQIAVKLAGAVQYVNVAITLNN
jgi:hypothetical protein